MSGAEAIAAIQLIDACIGIARAIFDISEAVKDAQGLPRKLRNLCEKLPAIEHLLQCARDSCKQGRISEDASKSAQPILRQCEQALAELQDVFQKACPQTSDNRSKRIWKGGKAVFFGRDSEVQKLLVSIQGNLRLLEQREIFSIGGKLDELQCLTEELAQDEASKYTHMGEGHIIANESGSPANFIMSGSGRQINNPGVYNEGPSIHTHNYIQEAKYFDRFMTWLSPPDPVDNLKKSLARRSPGTGEWYLRSRQYESWKTSKVSFTWLHGSAGSGKTVLSAGIIEDLRDFCNGGTTGSLAFFFFDFHDSRKQEPICMVKSLISQLLSSFSSLPDPVRSLYASCGDGKWPASDQQLLQALRDSLAVLPSSFIVLDALDECSAIDTLFDVLEEIQSWRESCLHMLVTSRNIIEMREGLEDLVPIDMRTCLQSQVVDKDIEAYVHRTLLNDRSFKGWQKKWQKDEARDVLDEIEGTLGRKAHGMFRWVTCQLDALAGCVNRAMVRRALDELPKDLPETYDRILRNIDRSRAATAAREILRWLVYAQRQLATSELLEVTGFLDQERPCFDREEVLGDLDDILRICSSLVSVTTTTPLFNIQVDDHGRWHDAGAQGAREFVQLAHASVKEYLVSNSPCLAHYSLKYRESHDVLASCCLVYLLRFEADEWTTNDCGSVFPLARYAAQFWTKHARIADGWSQQQKDLSIELLTRRTSAFRAWSSLAELYPGLTEQLPLLAASSEGLTYAVRMILQNDNEDIDAQWGSRNALHAATARGHKEIVELLLHQGADVNAPSKFYNANALGIACQNGYRYEGIAMQLLARGADANAEYGYLKTSAFAIACDQGHENLVENIIATNMPVEACKGVGRALEFACARGYDRIVTMLVYSDAIAAAWWNDVDRAMAIAIEKKHYNILQTLFEVSIDGRPKTALCAACRQGDEKLVQKLLDMTGFADVLPLELNDSLHAACAGGHEGIVEMLFARGAVGGNDAFRAACNGGHEGTVGIVLARAARGDQLDFAGAIQHACCGGHPGIIQALLKNECGLASLSECGAGSLQMACAGGHRSIVETLLANGVSAKYTGRTHGNTLVIACERADDKIVKMLLDRGASVNDGTFMFYSRRYGTPLQTACEGGHIIIVRMLLEKGAYVNGFGGGYYGHPLHAACVRGHESIVDMLLNNGADVNALGARRLDEDGWCKVHSLTIACERGHKAIAKMLLDRGAGVENHRAKSDSGSWGPPEWLPNRNALVAACDQGHEGVVRKILMKTAKVDFEESSNGTALLAACAGGFEEIVDMLLEKDAKVAIRDAYNDAIQAASDAGFEGIVEMLLDWAASCNTSTTSRADTMSTNQVSLVKRRRMDDDLFPSVARA